MAREAEQLLAGSGWLPEPLRTLAGPSDGRPVDNAEQALPDTGLAEADTPIEETAEIGKETAIDEIADGADDEEASASASHDFAAE